MASWSERGSLSETAASRAWLMDLVFWVMKVSKLKAGFEFESCCSCLRVSAASKRVEKGEMSGDLELELVLTHATTFLKLIFGERFSLFLYLLLLFGAKRYRPRSHC